VIPACGGDGVEGGGRLEGSCADDQDEIKNLGEIIVRWIWYCRETLLDGPGHPFRTAHGSKNQPVFFGEQWRNKDERCPRSVLMGSYPAQRICTISLYVWIIDEQKSSCFHGAHVRVLRPTSRVPRPTSHVPRPTSDVLRSHGPTSHVPRSHVLRPTSHVTHPRSHVLRHVLGPTSHVLYPTSHVLRPTSQYLPSRS